MHTDNLKNESNNANTLLSAGTTGKLLMEGWKNNSIAYQEYVDLAKKLSAEGKDGKSLALRKHTPIEKYIDFAYGKYRELCYYFGKQPLTKGAWLRSDACACA